ncbi:MAG TPA: hypothetical protein VFD94_01510 [Jatrophihabitans sp.]|nr:hypothetical protein [Jatrophihabitans sp.]
MPLERFAERYGTPLLVHDTAVLRHRATALQAVLPAGSRLLYSLKANPLPPVVSTLQAAGCGSEVSSPAELAIALAAGRPAPLCYTGPGKSADEIAAALAAGAVLCCESRAELDRARAVHGPGPLPVLLRVQPASRPPVGLSMADGRQFGLTEDEAVELCRHPPAGLEVLGFHCYLGSQLPDCAALLSAFGYVAGLIERLAGAGGIRPRIANLGGGFPWPYAMPGSGPELGPLRAELDKLLAPLIGQGTEVWFESGRGLVAAAGRLLTTVMDVKQRGDSTLVVVDAGIHILGGMSGLGRVLRPSTGFHNLTGPDGPSRTVDVVGPLCTPLDRLSNNTTLAEPRVGDLLCVDNVGAYASTAALTAFLSRPAAVELVTDGEQVQQAWTLRTGHVPISPAGR